MKKNAPSVIARTLKEQEDFMIAQEWPQLMDLDVIIVKRNFGFMSQA